MMNLELKSSASFTPDKVALFVFPIPKPPGVSQGFALFVFFLIWDPPSRGSPISSTGSQKKQKKKSPARRSRRDKDAKGVAGRVVGVAVG